MAKLIYRSRLLSGQQQQQLLKHICYISLFNVNVSTKREFMFQYIEIWTQALLRIWFMVLLLFFFVSIQSFESEIMINQRNNVCYLIFSFSSWFLFSIAFQVFDLLIQCYTFHWNIERLSIVTHWKFVLMITITWKLLVFIQTIDCQCAIFFPSVCVFCFRFCFTIHSTISMT